MNLNLQPTLENDLLSIRPLQEQDFEALYQVAKDPLIWEQHPSQDRYKREVFAAFFEDSMKSKGALIVTHKANMEVIGSSRFKVLENTDSAVEIGWSFLSRSYWGGKYNKAMKTMMIEHAFGTIDCVVLYVGKRNLRSQKAVEKIGGIKVSMASHPLLVKRVEGDFTFIISKKEWANRKDMD